MKKIMLRGFCLLLASILVGCTTPNQNNDTNESLNKPNQKTETNDLLTKEEALSIALKDCNLDKDEITKLNIEKDYDHNQTTYEISFHHKTLEYEYEIDAIDGEIISYDVDEERL